MGTAFDLNTIVETYQTPLLLYVRQLMGATAEEVEDVVQDTFLRLHKQVCQHGEDSVKRVSSWLFRVAHNLAMDAGRRRQRRRRLQESVLSDPVANPARTGAAPHPAQALGRREACALAVGALERLPAEQKQVLLLKTIQGFTLREISDVTGLKIGTVNYRLTQGLRALSRQLKQAGAL